VLAATVAALAVNLAGHAVTIIRPPGGSIFTALLTDLEILARYLVNLVAPVHLSAVYFVDPVRTVYDARPLLYGLILAAVAVATLKLAANPRRAVFGWLWFLGALGPSLNLIAIPHLMQDRYVYLSTPGAFLVLAETAAGLRVRLQGSGLGAEGWRRALWACSGGYVVLLVVLAVLRSAAWSSTLTLFQDAVRKQPQAAFAHFGLGSAYAQIREDRRRNPKADQRKLEELRQLSLQEWKDGVDRCPDGQRYTCFLTMALSVGEEFRRQGKPQIAEYYLDLATRPPPEAPDDPCLRAAAQCALGSLRLAEGRLDEAYLLAGDAVAAADEAPPRMLRARVQLALAATLRQRKEDTAARDFAAQARRDAEEACRYADKALAAADEPATRLTRADAAVCLATVLKQTGADDDVRRLIAQARQDAQSVHPGTDLYPRAHALLQDPALQGQAPPIRD